MDIMMVLNEVIIVLLIIISILLLIILNKINSIHYLVRSNIYNELVKLFKNIETLGGKNDTKQ